MSVAWAETLREQLIKNGVELGAPLDLNDIHKFEAAENLRLCSSFREIYLAFNGFHLPDDRNMFSWWSLERVREENQKEINSDGKVVTAFGDFWIDAHFALTSLTEDDVPVYFHEGNNVLTANVREFLERLARIENLYTGAELVARMKREEP